MIIKLRTLEELKKQFLISFRNNNGDKVTKVTATSIINGFAYAISKIVQKINSDAALLETKIFPEYAVGEYLDEISNREGYPERDVASKSSTILLFQGDSGTIYPINTQVRSASGVIFSTLSALTLDDNGFGYVMSESTLTGSDQNVDANTLVTLVSTAPTGHVSVTNPVKGVNGVDAENDYNYRKRILSSQDIYSKNTVAFYEALVRNINSQVLRITSNVKNRINNQFDLIVVKNSGANFTTQELTDIKNGIKNYVPLADYGDNTFSVLNITFTYLDIYVPLKLENGYVLEDVLRSMQVNVLNYLDLNKWNFGKNVNWEYLLSICLNTEGVKEIDETNFTPNRDLSVSKISLPRLRNFSVKNLNNNVTINRVDAPGYWLYNKEEKYNIKNIVS